jgi:hypothetical protein
MMKVRVVVMMGVRVRVGAVAVVRVGRMTAGGKGRRVGTEMMMVQLLT